MKKTICWVALICLLLASAPIALAEGEAHAITEQAMDFYMFDPETVRPGRVWFVDGADVPYLALSEWPSLVEAACTNPDKPNEGNALVGMTFSMEGGVGRLTRTDGYYVTFDCDSDVIHFLDFDGFMRAIKDTFLIDMVDYADPTPDGVVTYFRRDPGSYERYGREVDVNAGAYGIDFIAQDGECYVPLQTLSDFLLSFYYKNLFYNGEAVFFSDYCGFGLPGKYTTLGEAYYSVAPHARSETMARFTYGELCMVLDAMYGLKENHRIDSFDALADITGLKPALTGTDPVAADRALYQLLELHLGDLHTAYTCPSPLSGAEASANFRSEMGVSLSRAARIEHNQIYTDLRSAVYPDGVPAYEEIGNTAFITFDGFESIPEGVDYYQTPPTEAAADTIGIMLYAYGQITRADSPIENVVLDLSCNHGGDSDTAIFTVAAFLGNCSLSLRDTFSNAMATGLYQVDMNLDGQFDEKDLALKGKNLFCIESPVSFSCGNLVPCAFKASNKVTLMGRTSGGGACAVLPLSTADGTCFQISSPLQLSFLKNGSFYDIDQGAAPDIYLMKLEQFYDRQGLVDSINGAGR